MAATLNDELSLRRSFRWKKWLWLGMIAPTLALWCWWLTEPFEKPDSGLAGELSTRQPSPTETEPGSPAKPAVVWPATVLAGDAAKSVVMDALHVANERL